MSLRRSRRSEKHTLGAGDKVEVLRDDGNIEIGTLLHVVDESDSDAPKSSSYVPRWMVQFPNDSEEYSEKSLGRLVAAVGDESEDGSSKSETSPVAEKTASQTSRGSSRNTKQEEKIPSGRVSTRATIKRTGGKKSKLSAGLPPPLKKPARRPVKKANENETVETFKMLTGTLFLYRGPNPRAEFVRIV